MARFLLHHRHEPRECGVAFAAFKGHNSPLRHTRTMASCLTGNHDIWWDVEAISHQAALALLPPYVAQRTTATEIRQVTIP